MRIAIIGAGLAGLTAACHLKQNPQAEITIYEKARGVAGRMATRIAPPFEFDFGTQFFTVKTQTFQKFLERYISNGIVQNWQGTFCEFDKSRAIRQVQWAQSPRHYVASPSMTALCKALAQSQNINLKTKVSRVAFRENTWALFDDNEMLGNFDTIILAIPVKQACSLIADMPEISFFEAVKNIKMVGCFSLMLGLSEPLNLNWEAALINNSDISWISINNSKPSRNNAFSVVVHSTNKWAEEHIEWEDAKVEEYLLNEANEILIEKLESKIIHKDLHRWRYANISKQKNGQNAYFDSKLRIGLCGDWCIHGRVEAAFLSGKSIAEQIGPTLG